MTIRLLMRDFLCPNCGQRLAFENSRCLNCNSEVGFSLSTRDFVVLSMNGVTSAELSQQRCANSHVAVCNWLVPVGPTSRLCASCRLTRTRPSDGDAAGLPEFAAAEAAKRRLVLELTELGLPVVGRESDPERGLCFDLLSSEHEPVITGHDSGVITLDLAESDDVHREQLRTSMDEPYRTLLGHFRHEVGHYYNMMLADTGAARDQFEVLFGDPDLDYQQALDRHYADGAPAGWQETFISAYATMHPTEDWAETFAHYLHIRDTVDTAAAFGFAPAGTTSDRPLPGTAGFDWLIQVWMPLSWALNMINRSMGHSDLYPFILAPTALDKMRLVHELVTACGTDRPATDSDSR